MNPSNNSSSLVITVDAPPVIIAGPTNLAVVAGATASFAVTLTGTPAPVCRWFFNTSTNPVGVNSNVLTLTNIQPSQAGSYFVLVTNVAGSMNSAPATLTVDVRPIITVPPSNQVVALGANVTFTVSATGNPAPAYQWFLNGTNPVGGNASLLTLNNVQPAQAGSYSVLATNLAGATNSVPATLTLLVPPVITSISVSAAGVSVSFPSVTNLNYTLEYKDLLTDPAWTTLSPATPGTGGTLILQDTNSLPALRFYRVLCD